MKLAEALILRADLQRRIEQIKNRLRNNVKIQEGDRPEENPGELFSELDRTIDELEDIVIKINKTNNETKLDDGSYLMEALSKRDGIWAKRQAYSEMVQIASEKRDAYTRSEVRFVSSINVAETQKKVDKLSKEWRELDTKIQGLNWNTDLIE